MRLEEALFRTCKYVPNWPTRGFATIDEARTWVQDFVRWYNLEHLHSALRFVTPDQRHRGEERGPCSPNATASMKLPVRPTPNGGQAIPATGNPLARSG